MLLTYITENYTRITRIYSTITMQQISPIQNEVILHSVNIFVY